MHKRILGPANKSFLLPQNYHFDLLSAIAHSLGVISSMYRAKLFIKGFGSVHAMIFLLNSKKKKKKNGSLKRSKIPQQECKTGRSHLAGTKHHSFRILTVLSLV